MGHGGSIRSVVGIAAAGACLIAAPSASAADLYVDDGGSDGGGFNGCANPASPCKTIAHAILVADGNASPTDSVRVGGGSYSEAVSLPPGISLLKDVFGPGFGTIGAATINGGASPAVTVEPGAPMRQLGGEFVFKGDSDHDQGSVLVAGGANAGYVTISGATFNDTATFKQLDILDGSPRVTSNTFTATIDSPNREAIRYEGDGSPEIGGNSIGPSGAATSAYLEGVHVKGVGGSATPSIHDNAISGIGVDIADTGGTGIRLETASGQISGNTIHKAPSGATQAGIRVEGNATATGTPLSLSRNQAYDFNTGAVIGTEDPVTLSSDVFADNVAGISLTAPAGVTATGITTRNNGGSPAEIALVNTPLTLDSSFLGSAGPVVALIGTSTCTSSFSMSTEAPGNCGLAPVASPMFANQAMDDYHLLPGSPLIEAGNPAPPAAGALDLDGTTRAVDGNGDCIVRRDVGADEFVGPAAACPGPSAATPVVPTPPRKKKCKRKKRGKRGSASAKRCKKRRK